MITRKGLPFNDNLVSALLCNVRPVEAREEGMNVCCQGSHSRYLLRESSDDIRHVAVDLLLRRDPGPGKRVAEMSLHTTSSPNSKLFRDQRLCILRLEAQRVSTKVDAWV